MTFLFANEIKDFENKTGDYFKLSKDIYLSDENKFISSGEIVRIEYVRVMNNGKSQWTEFDNYRIELKINNIDFGVQDFNLSIYDVKNIKDIESYFNSIFQII